MESQWIDAEEIDGIHDWLIWCPKMLTLRQHSIGCFTVTCQPFLRGNMLPTGIELEEAKAIALQMLLDRTRAYFREVKKAVDIENGVPGVPRKAGRKRNGDRARSEFIGRKVLVAGSVWTISHWDSALYYVAKRTDKYGETIRCRCRFNMLPGSPCNAVLIEDDSDSLADKGS